MGLNLKLGWQKDLKPFMTDKKNPNKDHDKQRDMDEKRKNLDHQDKQEQKDREQKKK